MHYLYIIIYYYWLLVISFDFTPVEQQYFYFCLLTTIFKINSEVNWKYVILKNEKKKQYAGIVVQQVKLPRILTRLWLAFPPAIHLPVNGWESRRTWPKCLGRSTFVGEPNEPSASWLSLAQCWSLWTTRLWRSRWTILSLSLSFCMCITLTF